MVFLPQTGSIFSPQTPVPSQTLMIQPFPTTPDPLKPLPRMPSRPPLFGGHFLVLSGHDEAVLLWRNFWILDWGFPGGSVVKNLPAMQEARVQFLGREDPLEKGMATHSSILAWRSPWTEEPGRLQSLGLQRVGHD